MNFFQPIIENPNASAETLEKKRISWNKGLSLKEKGIIVHQETLDKISKAHKGKIISLTTRAKLRDANLGKKANDETRAKQKATAKKRNYSPEMIAKFTTSKPLRLMTPNGLFPSIKAVCEASGKCEDTIRKWIKKWPEHYYYPDRPTDFFQTRTKAGTPFMTPIGLFKTRASYAKFSGLNPTTVERRAKNHPTEYYYIKN